MNSAVASSVSLHGCASVDAKYIVKTLMWRQRAALGVGGVRCFVTKGRPGIGHMWGVFPRYVRHPIVAISCKHGVCQASEMRSAQCQTLRGSHCRQCVDDLVGRSSKCAGVGGIDPLAQDIYNTCMGLIAFTLSQGDVSLD